MSYLFAALPILLVLLVMLAFRRSSHEAGITGWLAGVVIAIFAFGLNWQVFWVSQVKGLLLTSNVLLVLWTGLVLYHLVKQAGGIQAITLALQEIIPDPGWLFIIQAWMVSALVENLAGYGLPIAIVAPMLIALGISPVRAVAAAAIGHAWAVSLSGMGLPIRTIADVTSTSLVEIFPTSAILLGVLVLLSGLSVAMVLGQLRYWPKIILLSIVVALTQYGIGALGMIPLGSFVASIVGVFGGYLLSKRSPQKTIKIALTPQLKAGIFSYGFLIFSVVLVSAILPINRWLGQVQMISMFPEVVSKTGVLTKMGPGYIFKPFVHPGTLILATVLFTVFILPMITGKKSPGLILALKSAFHSALPASLGLLFMMGLSTLMEHTGMTLLIAEGLSRSLGAVYPLLSPLVGMIGAFATGSNVNSNVLFGPMQKAVADLLKINTAALLAAQTTGGSLGSMIAPAKLAVGGSTNSMKGREGEVLRLTLPVGIVSTLVIGLIVWILIILK